MTKKLSLKAYIEAPKKEDVNEMLKYVVHEEYKQNQLKDYLKKKIQSNKIIDNDIVGTTEINNSLVLLNLRNIYKDRVEYETISMFKEQNIWRFPTDSRFVKETISVGS